MHKLIHKYKCSKRNKWHLKSVCKNRCEVSYKLINMNVPKELNGTCIIFQIVSVFFFFF